MPQRFSGNGFHAARVARSLKLFYKLSFITNDLFERMHLLLADDEGFEARIELPEHIAEPLWVQLDRIGDPKRLAAFKAALVKEVATALTNFLDPDLAPPTDKQVAFAKSIARARGLSIPREALIYRTAMFDFLSQHAPPRRT